MNPLRLALAICLVALAACGSSAPVATVTAPVRVGPPHHLVLVSAFAFSTQRTTGDTTVLEIPKGDVVGWFKSDGTTHHVTSGTPPTADGKFDGEVPASGVFEFLFNEAGTYRYFCSVHPSMTGTIIVK